ncbi:MAG: GxxExxY protein [Phycisphaerales bacterium]
MPTDATLDALSHRVIGAAIEVHRALGPGLLESAYQACLAAELSHLSIGFVREVPVPIVYGDQRLDAGYRIDFLVENGLIVETKALQGLLPVHEAQLLSHMRLAGKSLGLLINFHEVVLRNGIKRRVL